MVESMVHGGEGQALMVNDVSRAYFYAPVEEQVYTELLDEEKEDGRDLVGRLRKAMYGTRSAAQAWQREVNETMKEIGFKVCKVSPCIFYHSQRRIRSMIHGDDFMSSGKRGAIDVAKEEARGKVQTPDASRE